MERGGRGGCRQARRFRVRKTSVVGVSLLGVLVERSDLVVRSDLGSGLGSVRTCSVGEGFCPTEPKVPRGHGRSAHLPG